MNNFTYLENADGGEVGVNGAEERYTVRHGTLFLVSRRVKLQNGSSESSVSEGLQWMPFKELID